MEAAALRGIPGVGGTQGAPALQHPEENKIFFAVLEPEKKSFLFWGFERCSLGLRNRKKKKKNQPKLNISTFKNGF